jgi:hypothetical protein
VPIVKIAISGPSFAGVGVSSDILISQKKREKLFAKSKGVNTTDENYGLGVGDIGNKLKKNILISRNSDQRT